MIIPRSVSARTCVVFGARNLAEERARLIGIIGPRLTVVRGHAPKAAPW
ncbi:hypothetical protein ACWKT5_09960 [Streptomyces avermitilis]